MPERSTKNMKSLIYSILTLVISMSYSNADADEEKKKTGLVSVYLDSIELPGTTLRVQNTYLGYKRTGDQKHSCIIGHERTRLGGSVFIPVIRLPALTNDKYLVEYKKGVITVTNAKKTKLFMSIDISAIAPTVVTEDFDEAEHIKNSRQIGTKQ